METLVGWRHLLEVEDPAARNALARSWLAEIRWPEGARCPRCGSARIAPVRARSQLDCRDCRYRFSVTAGTLFHNSNLPLWKWIAAVSLLVESDDGFPAQRLAQTLDVSYKTAWSIGHRIRATFANGTPPESNGRRPPASYHVVSDKYLQGYIAEVEWRERNRLNPDAFLDTVRTLVTAPPLH
jgi:transposase-like protein